MKVIKLPSTLKEVPAFCFSDSCVEEVVISEGTKSIANNAFSKSYIKNVVIPSTVINIDMCAFEYCRNLESISFPDDLLAIDNNICSFCVNLKEVKLPKHLQYINESAFRDCQALKSISFPETLLSIARLAFYCTALSSVKLPENLEVIADDAFANTHIDMFILPKETRLLNTAVNLFGTDRYPKVIASQKIIDEYTSKYTDPYTSIGPGNLLSYGQSIDALIAAGKSFSQINSVLNINEKDTNYDR